MKTELRKVYFCEHCKKHNLSASTISRHEKYCASKPENRHKCFQLCVYLKREKEVREGAAPYRAGSYGTVFTCEKTGNKMYSYQFEKKQSLYPFLISFAELTRMPLSCNLYKEMTYDEQEERFIHIDDYGE